MLLLYELLNLKAVNFTNSDSCITWEPSSIKWCYRTCTIVRAWRNQLMTGNLKMTEELVAQLWGETCTVRNFNCWRYLLALCDEVFEHFPLFDEMLRHIEFGNCVISQICSEIRQNFSNSVCQPGTQEWQASLYTWSAPGLNPLATAKKNSNFFVKFRTVVFISKRMYRIRTDC